MFICNGHVPDHSTIHRFRKRFGKEIDALFLQVTRSLMEEHTSVVLSLDGTKILASASRSRSCTWDQLEEKESLIRAQVKYWDEALDLAEAEAALPPPASDPSRTAEKQEQEKATPTKKDISQTKTDASSAEIQSTQETAPPCAPAASPAERAARIAEIRKQRDRKKKALTQVTQAKRSC